MAREEKKKKNCEMSLHTNTMYGISWTLKISSPNSKQPRIHIGKGQALYSKDIATSFVDALNYSENEKTLHNIKNFDISYRIYSKTN